MRHILSISALALTLSISGSAPAQEPGDIVRFITRNQPPAEVHTTGTVSDRTADSLFVNTDPSGTLRALARSDLVELWIWRVGWTHREPQHIVATAAAVGLWYAMLSRANYGSNRWKWTLTGAGVGAMAGAAHRKRKVWWEPVPLEARR